MAETVTCPVCGEPNSAENEFCRNCQSRLIPLTGPLKNENSPIQPGDKPTTKKTGDLEPALPRWLRDARDQALRSGPGFPEGVEEEPKPSAAPPPPDLLAGLESQRRAADDDTPEWVARIAGAPSTSERPERQGAKYVELPVEEETTAPEGEGEVGSRPEEPAKPGERDELGDWFRQAASNTKPRPATAADLPQPAEPPAFRVGSEEVPSWLKGLEAQAAAEQASQGGQSNLPLPSNEPPQVTSTPELPTWLKNLGAEPASTEPPSFEEQVPGWLKTAKKPERDAAGASPGTPDWVASLPHAEPGTDTGASGSTPGTKPAEIGPDTGAPAFAADSLSTRDVDAIFASMQTPDWLADATRGSAGTSDSLPPAALEQPAITPAELPSWVQAMRPVESDVPVEAPTPVDSRTEDGGPLAGLQGVLPVIPGIGTATSKPEAQATKLEATTQQQAHAELLEKILASEVTPIPMKTIALVGAQRGLRWAITGIMLVILGSSVISGSQIFPLPLQVTIESNQAVKAVGEVPEGAPVLLVFDYEPATNGEMEASGASLIDHLLLLRHPQLALISTSPTGSALAERFMSTTLADRKYQRGMQYVDLGFLPGGLAGVHEFARSPAVAVPLGADSAQVWASPVLQGVRSLSDFASIIILTDSAESGRIWVEQTAGLRGGSSMILVSSAQAGPMLLPYFDAGQINGLVAGVNGAVGAEQANGGLPGFVRRYWDAYCIGLFVATFLMAAGGLWSLWRGMQDRRAEQAG